MSKRKDIERAKTVRYRSGVQVGAAVLDREEQARKQKATDDHIKALGLVKATPKLVVARRKV